jgi:hypothetical protein
MEVEQALAILIQASELAPLPKSGHLQVEVAAKILAEFIKTEHSNS